MRKGLLLAAATLALAAPPARASFEAGELLATGAEPVVAVADMDGDGRDDIVESAAGNLRVFLAQPDGTHFLAATVGVTGRPGRIQIAELTGDGRADIVLSGPSGFTVVHAAASGYHVALERSAAGEPGIADIDGDGRLNVIAASGSGVRVWSAGAGGYSAAEHATLAPPTTVQIDDWTGDGVPDVLAPHGDGRSSLLAGVRGGIAPAVASDIGGWEAGPPVAGDFDEDGVPEEARLAGDRRHLEVRRTPAGPARRYALPGPANGLVADDFDGDGHTDLATLTRRDGAVWLTVLPGAADGFGAAVDHSLGATADDATLAGGDLDHDARPDVVVREGDGLRIWSNRTPRLVLGALALRSRGTLEAPYALEHFGHTVASLRVEIKRPRAAGFELHAPAAPTATGTIHVSDDYVIEEGEWRLRVTAYGHDGRRLETLETATVVQQETDLALALPVFGEQAVGVSGAPRHVGITNAGRSPLRIRRLAVDGDEFALIGEDCTGRALAPAAACTAEIVFTPQGPGERLARLELEANAAWSGEALRGIGVPPAAPSPTIVAPAPIPAPAPRPAPPAKRVEATELSFDSVPGRTATRLFGLRLERVRPGSLVVVRCATGCPVKRYTKRKASGTVSLTRFAKHRLKAGTRIRITVDPPGYAARSVTLTIRAGRAPRVSGSL